MQDDSIILGINRISRFIISGGIMRKRVEILIALLAVWVFMGAASVAGQECECGTVLPPEQIRHELEIAAEMQQWLLKRSDTHYLIPIAVHIVRRTDGGGGLDPDEMDTIFGSANVHFSLMDVSIFQYGAVDYIDDDYFYYNMDIESNWTTLRQTNVVPEAINIYFVPEQDTSGFPYCGISAFTFSSVQGILINNQCVHVETNRSTLAHEIGHYFNLYHTHEPAYGTECPDGSNCDYTGDLICDTPADPNLYVDGEYHVSEYPECEYDNYIVFAPGCDMTQYDPQTENLMSYSRKLCRDLFTTGQGDRFRATLENERTELLYGMEGFLAEPWRFDNLSVTLGGVLDTSLDLTWMYADIVYIYDAVTGSEELTVTGPLPAALGEMQTLTLNINFDASELVDICDMKTYYDTIQISTSSADLPIVSIPVAVSLSFVQPAQDYNIFGPECLRFNVPNTPGIGNASDSAFVIGYQNLLYDGSLLIGLVDGSDTVVYQDLYTQADYAVADAYIQSTDDFGRTVQTMRFVTADGRLHGEVRYTYGNSTPEIDSCKYLIIDYLIENPCDSALNLLAGMFCDFDIMDSYVNPCWVDVANNLIAVSSESNSLTCGLAGLYSCGSKMTFRPLFNDLYIFQTGDLPDETAYSLLAASSNGQDIDYGEVSALMSFGQFTLDPAARVGFRAAILYQYFGVPDFGDLLDDILSVEAIVPWDNDMDCVENSADNCPDVYNPGQEDSDGDDIGDACEILCGDANGDEQVNVSDAVSIINYVFVGGPAPDPLESGDVNCDDVVNVSDAVWIINYIFVGGNVPCDTDGDDILDC
jgi:hypothetical protein